uniref:Kelch-like protein diablo n=1 Tax=Glossina pallidipes TaxID=7398 RepID=A0A1A9ZYG2_GLOPL
MANAVESNGNRCEPTDSETYSNPSYSRVGLDVLNKQRQEGKLCDFILEAEDELFHVHKTLLVTVSPYFVAMFQDDVRKNADERIKLTGVDAVALKAIVDYMYTGEITITEGSVQALLSASDLLQIDWLKNQCELFLKRRVKSTNCFGIWRVADMYSCKELFHYCNKYILLCFPRLVDTKEFLTLSFDELKMIITDDNLYVRGEDIAYHGLLKWVKHDPESRRFHLYELMSQIHLPRVRPRLLKNHIFREPVFKNDGKSKQLLTKALSDSSFSFYEGYYPCSPRYGTPHVLFAGGIYENKQLFPCKLRNIFFDEELTIRPMREHRNHLSVASLNGFVYCTGGVSGSLLLRSAEYYDPIVNEWNLIAQMKDSHHSHGSCVFNNHIYVIGGYKNSTVENYNPKTDKWYSCPNTPSQYSTGNRAAVIENCIYSLGDYESTTLNNRFDPREGRWQRLSSAPYRWRDTEIASYGQSLYCIGGDFDSHQCTRYDVRFDRWETLSSMMSGRCGHSVVIYKNKIYVFGGNRYPCYDERYYIRINEWKRFGIESIDRQYGGGSLIYTNLDNMKNFLCL